MSKMLLRSASIACLAIWLAIWVVFLLVRLSSFEFRGMPGVGMFMLTALALALVAPIMAAALAGAALARQPRAPRDMLTFGCAIAALFGQAFLFLLTRWL